MLDVDKIKDILQSRLLTQQEVAEMAGVQAGTISRMLLTGRARYETVVKLAKALDVEPVELLRKEF
ncbi:MAG: helix-turn-helix transcriptional regulator [Clostridiaceae bacterium]|nr:helix-turn-helix transcriptional regulator [Clostridiaceae bacterium]